jgi:hypothetical protein
MHIVFTPFTRPDQSMVFDATDTRTMQKLEGDVVDTPRASSRCETPIAIRVPEYGEGGHGFHTFVAAWIIRKGQAARLSSRARVSACAVEVGPPSRRTPCLVCRSSVG